jgi:hypothetical protein
MASTRQRPNGESEQRFIPEALNAPQRLLPKLPTSVPENY